VIYEVSPQVSEWVAGVVAEDEGGHRDHVEL
jgi:hypothetical protein